MIIRSKRKKKEFTWKVDKLVYDIEGLLLNSKYLENRLYQAYLGLEEKSKRGFKRELAQLIQEEIVGKEFLKALAKDIIKEEDREGEKVLYVDIESYVYKYLRKVFRGNVVRLLRVLRDSLEDCEDE